MLTARPLSVQIIASETPLAIARASAEPRSAIESNTSSMPLTVPIRPSSGAIGTSVRSTSRFALIAVLMREIVARARALFHKGLPLVQMVEPRLALDIDLFNRGGLRVLDKIERQGYDVLAARPSISKAERVRLLLASLARAALRAA